MIWRAVLASRVRMARHELLGHAHGAKRRPASLRPLLAMALAVLLAAVVCTALVALFLAVRDDGAQAREASAGLALVLSATLVGLVVFDLHEAVSTLVLDSDLEFLRRAPVPPWALFALKLADAFPRTSALLVILAVPALVAFGMVYPVPAWCWLLVVPALLALWGFAVGLGVAAAVLLLRVVPARAAREVLGLLSTLAIFGLWLANSFLLPRVALESESPRALVAALDAHTPFLATLSPGTWVARMMAAASDAHAAAALTALGIAALGAVAALLLAGTIAAHGLDTVQGRVFGAGARPERRQGSDVTPRFAAHPSVLRAIVRRDLVMFTRDATVLGDILIASVLWTLLPLLAAPLVDIDRAVLARAMLLALTVALGFEIGTRAIPFERRGIAWMRLAPVAAWRWVLYRGLSTLALALPIVAIATFAVSRVLRIDSAALAETLALVAPALVLALAIGIWTGALHGNFEWTQPRAMLTMLGRALATMLLMVQAIGWLGAALVMQRLELHAPLYLPALAALALAALLLAHAARVLRLRQW